MMLAACPTQPAESYRQHSRTVSTHVAGWYYVPQKRDYVDVFHKAVKAWKTETEHLSHVEDMTSSPHFKTIVDLGTPAIELIIGELQRQPSFLFLALEEITREDPVAPTSYGKPIEMVNDWLRWYENAGVNAS